MLIQIDFNGRAFLMTNISVVVILYNSRLSDSETLQSILSANLLHSIVLTINIWNNGPQKFNNEDIRLFLEKAKKKNFY